MKYKDIRFSGPVRLGDRDGVFYAAGPLVEIEREGDTVTLTGPTDVVDVPWGAVLFATRLKEAAVAPAAATKPVGTPRKAR